MGRPRLIGRLQIRENDMEKQCSRVLQEVEKVIKGKEQEKQLSFLPEESQSPAEVAKSIFSNSKTQK